jgi:hypothetical protein
LAGPKPLWVLAPPREGLNPRSCPASVLRRETAGLPPRVLPTGKTPSPEEPGGFSDCPTLILGGLRWKGVKTTPKDPSGRRNPVHPRCDGFVSLTLPFAAPPS